MISTHYIKNIFFPSAFLFTFCLIVPAGTEAATINAASCSQSAVQSAINSAGTGDSVNVPACSSGVSWSSQLTITKSITLQGAGVGKTVIISGAPSSSGLIRYSPANISSDSNVLLRITGFTFNAHSDSTILHLVNSSTISLNKLRVDNNAFLNCGGGSKPVFHINGTIYGVVDNNTFSGYPHFDNYGIGGGGKDSWNGLTFNFGTAQNLYYEDNIITNDSATGVHAFISGGHGGRYAYRYNDFVVAVNHGMSPNFDVHGNQGSGIYGTMGIEIYGNRTTMNYNNGAEILDQRGGRGVFFNNAVISTGNVSSEAREEYIDNGSTTLTNHLCPSGTLYAGAYSCASNGQPMHVSGSYYWNNRKNYTALFNPGITTNSAWVNGLAFDKNLWRHTESFNGTSGVGIGPLSGRPKTCTTGVGYWVTNQSASNITGLVGKNPATPISGTLYRCNSTNVWNVYYTPYTYPHPLRSGSTPSPSCTPNWTCTTWSACVNSTQNRTCTDSNSCGTTSGKPAESQSCSNPAKTADLNADNKIDIFDYTLFSQNFGKTGSNIADLNNDSKVDIFDFTIFAGEFGKNY